MDEGYLPSPGPRYFECEVMKEWGLTPDDWARCSRRARAEMLAHEIHRGKRSAWREAYPPPDKKNNKGGRRNGIPADLANLWDRFYKREEAEA